MGLFSTDDLIDQLTGMQPEANRQAFRNLIKTIQLQAKAEGRMEAARDMNTALTHALAGSLH